MNTIKNSMRLAKIFAFALSVVIFFFPSVAMATTIHPPCTNFDNGGVSKTEIFPILPGQTKILKGEVTELTDNSIVLDALYITDAFDGRPKYYCPNAPFTVKQGDDLIGKCGGGDPADFEEGLAALTFSFSNAQPNSNGEICISLTTGK